MADKLLITIHDSKGLHMVEGYPKFGNPALEFGATTAIRMFSAASNGKRIALIANGCVQVLSAPSWQVQHTLPHSTAQDLLWSPKADFLAVYCTYIKKADTSEPNLHIYSLQKGKCELLKSFFQISQVGWQPQWTGDDKVFSRSVNNEVHFYNSGDLSTTAHKRLQSKVKQFSISPSNAHYHVIFFTPSVKGAPCLLNLFKYPHFSADQLPVCSKTFFKGESIEVRWNKQCGAAIVTAWCEKAEKNSYYGQKMLYLVNVKAQEAFQIDFPKDPLVTDAVWTPSGRELLVLHGANPACCSVLDVKGDTLCTLERGARNTILINPQSNLAMLGAMGNMSPKMEMWDLGARAQLANKWLADMTHMEWSPCGQYLLTATCAPRLRVNNGYRIYHYSGSLQHEYLAPAGTELYGARWLPNAAAAKPFAPSLARVPGIQSAAKVASTQAYVPPSKRALGVTADTTKQFLSQLDKYDPNSTAALANAPPPPLSKKALKNKKARENKRLRAEQESAVTISEPEFAGAPKRKEQAAAETASVTLAGDGEKTARGINKKLKKIKQLNQSRAEGKELTKEQLKLVSSEKELLAQLSSLKV